MSTMRSKQSNIMNTEVQQKQTTYKETKNLKTTAILLCTSKNDHGCVQIIKTISSTFP